MPIESQPAPTEPILITEVPEFTDVDNQVPADTQLERRELITEVPGFAREMGEAATGVHFGDVVSIPIDKTRIVPIAPRDVTPQMRRRALGTPYRQVAPGVLVDESEIR